MGTLGGISCPSTAAQLIIPVAYPLGYPMAVRRGIMMLPMHATAEEAVPEIEPKMAQATMLAAPMPPRTRPSMELAKFVRRSAIPAELMRAPAMMKKGMERIVREFNPRKPMVIRKEKSGKKMTPM